WKKETNVEWKGAVQSSNKKSSGKGQLGFLPPVRTSFLVDRGRLHSGEWQELNSRWMERNAHPTRKHLPTSRPKHSTRPEKHGTSAGSPKIGDFFQLGESRCAWWDCAVPRG